MNLSSHRTLWSFAAVVALAAGCSPSPSTSEPPVPEVRQNSSNAVDNARREAAQALDPSRDYAFAQRAEFAQGLQSEIARLKTEIDEFSGKAERATEPARTEAKAKLHDLGLKLSLLKERLDGIPAATESTWDDVKAGLRKAHADAKEATHQARQWLSEKIAP